MTSERWAVGAYRIESCDNGLVARPCKICVHLQRAEIEACLINGDPAPRVAETYGLSVSGIVRHKANCKLARITARLPNRSRVDVLANLELLASDAARLQNKAEEDGSHMACAQLIGRRKDLVMAINEVQGPEERDIDLTKHPRFIEFRDAVLSALQCHPDALHAVLRALGPGDGGDSKKG